MNAPSIQFVSAEKVITAKQRATIWSVLVLLMLGMGVWSTAGHPRSNWFYPFVLVIGALGVIRILALGPRPLAAGDAVPKSIPRSLVGAALVFAGVTAAMYLYWNLLWTETFTWGADVVVGGMAAVNYYRQKRGHTYSSWPSAIVFFVVLGASILLLWAGVIPRGHF